MKRFDTLTERIFRERVKVQVTDVKYCEHGMDFIRFKDPETGKVFEVRVIEQVEKEPRPEKLNAKVKSSRHNRKVMTAEEFKALTKKKN